MQVFPEYHPISCLHIRYHQEITPQFFLPKSALRFYSVTTTLASFSFKTEVLLVEVAGAVLVGLAVLLLPEVAGSEHWPVGLHGPLPTLLVLGKHSTLLDWSEKTLSSPHSAWLLIAGRMFEMDIIHCIIILNTQDNSLGYKKHIYFRWFVLFTRLSYFALTSRYATSNCESGAWAGVGIVT